MSIFNFFCFNRYGECPGSGGKLSGQEKCLGNMSEGKYPGEFPTLAWKCLQGVAPAYLPELCVPVDSVHAYDLRRQLRRCKHQSDSGASLSPDCPRGTVCQQPCATTPQHLQACRSWKLIYSDNDEHHPAPLWRLFWSLTLWYKCSDLLTYLLTYLLSLYAGLKATATDSQFSQQEQLVSKIK